jgi:hypothetical protein
MFTIRRVVLQDFIHGALTTVLLLCGLPAHAQLKKGCSGIDHLGADSGNPFTAERVTISTTPSTGGTPKTTVFRENIARDSQGRIRIEKHGAAQPPDDRKTVTLETPDGQPFTVTREEYSTLIQIFDCVSGTFIRIQPGMRIAAVKEDTGPAPAPQPKHAYSTPYIPNPRVKIPPDITIEQLGTREFQGIPALGAKTTTLGTQKDGEWNGKPISESELWVSDDLAAHVLSIRKDLKTGMEGRSELLAIKRQEPDPALFEIPKDYEVNPARLPAAPGLGVVLPRPR